LPTDLSTNQRLVQLEALYEIVPVGLCFIDTGLRLVKANQQFAKLLERDITAVIGKPLKEVLPAGVSHLERDLRSLKSGDNVSSCSARLCDSSQMSQVNLARTRDENGLLPGVSPAFVKQSSSA